MSSIGSLLANPKLLNGLISNFNFRREILLILLLCCFIPTNASSKTWYPVIGLGGGIATTTNLNQAANFPIIDPATDEFFIYSPTNRKQTAGLIEVIIGAEREISPNWLMQPGLAYAQMSSYTPKGTLLQGADLPSSDLYLYGFKVLTRQLLAQAKLMKRYRDTVYPFVFLGLGTSCNSATQYDTTVPRFLTFTREYMNHSKNSFAYRVGLGVDKAILHYARIGISYRYAGLGKISLGSANIDNIPVLGTLSQSRQRP